MDESSSDFVNGETSVDTYKEQSEEDTLSTSQKSIPSPLNTNRPLTSKYSVELGFSFNLALGNNLEILRNAVTRQDFDLAVIVDGKEGAGKSVLGMQVAYFLDIERHIDLDTQVCFTPEQFKRAVNTLGKGKAVVWDEARAGLNRRRSTRDINLDITDMLAECRQNNLFMVIIMPSFYDMDKNVALHRTRILINAQYDFKGPRDKPLRRGFFRFYAENAKHKLYQVPEFRYTYPYLRNECFDGVFCHHYVVDEQAYRKRKKDAIQRYTKTSHGAMENKEIGRALAFFRKYGILARGWPSKLAEKMGVDRRTIYNWIDEFKDDGSEVIEVDDGI